MPDILIASLKGIGEKRALAFEKAGLVYASQLLYFFPTDYHDYTVATEVACMKHGIRCAVKATVLSNPTIARFGGMTIVQVRCCDASGKFMAKWFNQPYRANAVHAGQNLVFCGRVDARHGLVLQNPAIYAELPGVIPQYSVPKGITQQCMTQTVKQALSLLESVFDPIPGSIQKDCNIVPLHEAIFMAHLPQNMEQVENAKKRISFQNALYYLLTVEERKSRRMHLQGIRFRTEGMLADYIAHYSFPPTGAQRRVMAEIASDMQCNIPMNRLLQGDVGSGKTMVALYAMYIAVRNGYQAVLMAPTEILAGQHFRSLQRIFTQEQVVYLHGGMKKKERDAALKRIHDGTAAAIVGTHALLQESVQFAKLGLIVTDEQHRFGVTQRATLENKAIRPDVLVMSATPIPRTIALLMFGDLDLSVIDELPPGRKPVKTSFIPGHRRDDMYRYLMEQAELDVRSYVVCPLIEENEEDDKLISAEQLYGNLRTKYPEKKIGLLHGKMKNQEKDAILEAFRRGEIKTLISTTVIEVGVDVPEASIMVIESADRFGLAQLHQLRGRVGRGQAQAYCFLLSESDAETSMERINVITSTANGFEIAEQDMLQRGPGDFLGVRQHGTGNEVLSLDMETLALASDAAHRVMETPTTENNELLEFAMMVSEGKNGLITMN